MKNYMKYFLLMGLVSVASAVQGLEDSAFVVEPAIGEPATGEPEMIPPLTGLIHYVN